MSPLCKGVIKLSRSARRCVMRSPARSSGTVIVTAWGREHAPPRRTIETLAAQLIGASPDPVNPEDEVKDAAQDRRKPGKAYPPDGGANVALVEQNMQGDAYG